MQQPLIVSALAACVLAACTPSPPQDHPARAATDMPAPSAAPGQPAAPADPRLPAAAGAQLPDAFIGEWNAAPADCGTGNNDTRLEITRDRVIYWESSGPIAAVRVLGPADVRLTLQLSGEGETWTATPRFTLRGPDTLVATDDGGGQLLRQRCGGGS